MPDVPVPDVPVPHPPVPDVPVPVVPVPDRILAALSADALQIVLIDGFSGAGKSTLADAVVRAWTTRRGIRPQLLRLEWIYPGWDGLDDASAALIRDVLEPIARGLPGGYRRWDWEADAAAERHPIAPDVPLIVEGVGALTRRSRALAGLGVWIDLDERTRKHRALKRDGDTYRPHWDRWAAQERRFAARERPFDVADIRLDGAALAGNATRRSVP